MDAILVVNAGSSSIKFQAFRTTDAENMQRLIKGQIDGIGTGPRLTVKANDGSSLIDKSFGVDEIRDVSTAITIAADWLRATQNFNLRQSVIGSFTADRDTTGPS